ncbi:MAG: zinc ribbon domain-containing protein [Crocinitomicaceae bacterium]
MYPPELEKLIEYAIIDGELTSKEREILIRKSIELGVDQAEFEMVIDARVFEAKQKLSQKHSTLENTVPKSESSVDSKITHCPNCKSPLEGFVTSCDYCGNDLTDIKSNTTIHNLFQLLTEAEELRREDSDNPFAAVGRFYADAFSSITGPSKVDSKKIEIISSFPIPTTKEDILEFLTLAIPRAKKIGNVFTRNNPENKSHNLLAPVWKNKCDQVILKAKIAMREDSESLRLVENLANELKS